MKTKNIDILNTFLILISFVLAYLLPFQIFLLAYAILGPLHYFTEINWIRDKNYFVRDKNWIYLVLFFAFLLSIPFFSRLSFFDSLQENLLLQKIRFALPAYLNPLFLVGLITAFTLVTLKNKKQQYGTIGLGIVVAVLLYNMPLYSMIIGVFIPTIIHVYFFTLFFMWYGTLKNKNNIGYFNVILMLIVPVLIAIVHVDQNLYHFSDTVKSSYIANSFHVLNANISKILGVSDGTTFFFYEVADLKIQMFITFAYTYHYLNWFSKTTTIGWHQTLTSKKSLLIIILWIGAVGLYFYNYSVGLALLLFFSLLHVFMEFPLNIISIKAVGKSLFKS